MLKSRFVLSLGAALFASMAFAVTVSTDTTVGDAELATYTGADAIVIKEGVTLTFSEISSPFTLSAPISGAGTLKATSSKTLTLSGDKASFSGAFDFTDTPVNVSYLASLGTASVTFTANATAVTLTQMEGGTCANDLTIVSAAAKKATYSVGQGLSVTHSGVVKLCSDTGSSEVDLSGDGSMLFAGTLERVAANNNKVYLYTTVRLEPGVTLKNLKGGTGFYVNTGSHLWLDTDVSGAFSSGLSVVKGQLDLGSANAYHDGKLVCGSSSSPYGVVDLHGFPQTIDQFQVIRGSSGNESRNNFIFTSDDPTDLTVSGTLSTTGAASGDFAYARLNGHLSLVCGTDSTAATCKLSNYGTTKPSETDGALIAYNGTISLDANAQFTKLSALVVTNQGSVAIASGAAINSDCELWLSGAGKLSIAEGQSLTVGHCRYIDGAGEIHWLGNGVYEGSFGAAADWIEGAGTLLVKNGEPIAPVTVKDFHWNGSQGTDIATAANWNEEGIELSAFSANLHFNGGTQAAAATAAANVRAVEIARADDFTLGGPGLVSLGEGGLSVANADAEASPVFTVSAPVKVETHGQVWSVDGAVTLGLLGDLTSLLTVDPLSFTGRVENAANEVVLAGDNSGLSAPLVFAGIRKVTVKSDTGLGGGESATFHNVMPHFVDCVSNGVPVTVTALDHDDKEPFFSNAGKTFVQTGRFTVSARDTAGEASGRPQFNLDGLDITFAGGITVGRCDRTFFNVDGARLRIKGTSVTGSQLRIDGGNTTNSLVYLDVPLANKTYLGRTMLICGAENVLPQSNELLMSAASLGADSLHRIGAIDLNGFDQVVGKLSDDYGYQGKKAFFEGKAYFEIRSATPATLSMTQASGSKVVAIKVLGQASLDYAQTATYVITNAISTTCGDLTVSKGTLIFAKDSGWGGGTNVTVKAGATLGATAEGMATVFACAAKPNRSTVDLELRSATADAVTTYGKLQLAAGTAKVNTLRFDGVYQPAGTYGSSASAATHKDDSRFSGSGVLEVRHSTPGPYGLMLIVK